ncbi:putative reverse transcriptase domain-containing protein [Tanacetum coccineum]
MAPKRTTRSTPAATTATTSVTNAQLKAMIDQCVTDALAARDADRNTNGDDNHVSGIGVRRTERVAREYTYPDFMKTVGHDVAYAMTWTDLKKKMTDKMFPKESDKFERYVGGLPDMIHGSIVASKPKTMQVAIEIAIELMDKKIRTFAERQTENKRKHDDNQQPQRQENKRQNTGRAYTAGTVGHLARDCRSTANANTDNNQRGTGAGQKPTCYECGAHGHFKRDCPKLKNNNRGNQGEMETLQRKCMLCRLCSLPCFRSLSHLAI